MEGIDNAGTSTKYDYLSSYASNSSSQDKTPYYRTTSYASVIDTDELTKNYFEKYYNKPSTTGYSLLEREINVRSVEILQWRQTRDVQRMFTWCYGLDFKAISSLVRL